MKICISCNIEKPICAFLRGKEICRACTRKAEKAAYVTRTHAFHGLMETLNPFKCPDKSGICLITKCIECNRLMHDYYTEELTQGSRGKRNFWGQYSHKARSNHPWFYKNSYPGIDISKVCIECADNLKKISEVKTCSLCGKLGSKQRISYRWVPGFTHNFMREEYENGTYELFNGNLCVGCWNRLKPMSRVFVGYIENCKLINELTREISHARKIANNG